MLAQAGWYMAYGSNTVLVGFLLTSADVAYYGIVGKEDATYTTPKPADWDYNDMVIRWAEPVPEVGSMSMLGLALLSLGAARRRWLK